MRLRGQWSDKGAYLFHLELLSDLFHMVVYLIFFCLICAYYGLPLHIMRDLYMTCRSFKSRVRDLVRYRRITRNMNTLFPDATEEELARTDAVCIICRETMTSAKKLRCGHLFHFHCLRSWLGEHKKSPPHTIKLITHTHISYAYSTPTSTLPLPYPYPYPYPPPTPPKYTPSRTRPKSHNS